MVYASAQAARKYFMEFTGTVVSLMYKYLILSCVWRHDSYAQYVAVCTVLDPASRAPFMKTLLCFFLSSFSAQFSQKIKLLGILFLLLFDGTPKRHTGSMWRESVSAGLNRGHGCYMAGINVAHNHFTSKQPHLQFSL